MKIEIIRGCEARGDKESPYLTRYTLIERSVWQLCLHIFHRSDADDLHDHPWPFVSIVLWRGYIEHTPTGTRRIWPGMVLLRKATHRHRIELLNGKRAITLVFMGRRIREWGFYSNGIFTIWKKYFTDKGC